MNKGLEEIRNPIGCEFNVFRKKYVYTEGQVEIIERELKALEIIFKNGLNVPHQDLIKSSKDYNEYKEEYLGILRSHIEQFKYEIMYSEEDFDFLKKVLLWI